MGGPVFNAAIFVLIAVWIVMLALPGLKRKPPGFEPKVCPSCNESNDYEATVCKACGKPL